MLSKKTASDKELRHSLSGEKVASIVKEVDRSFPERKCKIFNSLSVTKANKVFKFLEPNSQAAILQQINRNKALSILEKMEPDDRARLFQELPKDISKQFLNQLSAKERYATSLLLQYPLETAGRVMSPFFITLSANMTVEQAIKKIRSKGADAETIYVLPVVDQNTILKGVVELKELIMAKSNSKIADLMHTDLMCFSVNDDQETVARYIQSTDWLAVPIVKDDNHLVGIVTIDDAMNIMEAEESEDIFHAGASGLPGKPYLSVPVFRLMKIRVVWLILLAIAGSLTIKVLNAFESTLDQVILLATFIPLLIGVGGNTGSQSATTIVRAIAVDDVRTSDFLTIALKETCVGILLGLTLGASSYIAIYLIFQQKVALIVSLSMVSICTIATLAGSIMPILARILKFDPAVMSAPLVSTVIDAAGLLIYFLIANLVLGF